MHIIKFISKNMMIDERYQLTVDNLNIINE